MAWLDAEKTRSYQKAWNKAHPDYKRNWYQSQKSSVMEVGGRGGKKILGIRVRVNVVALAKAKP